MNGAELCLDWNGKKVRWIYHVTKQSFDPYRVLVNNAPVEDCQRLQQAYRGGGLSVDATRFGALLDREENIVEIYL